MCLGILRQVAIFLPTCRPYNMPKRPRSTKISLGLLLLTVGFTAGYNLQPAQQHLQVPDNSVIIRSSQKGGCSAAILKETRGAKKTIDVLAYSFTAEEIADELISAYDRGVKVRIVCDRSQLNGKGSQLRRLQEHGIVVKVAKKVKIMHNKVIIIDDCVVFTGSYNFTKNAEKFNAENLVQFCSIDVTKAYNDIFSALWYNGKEL